MKDEKGSEVFFGKEQRVFFISLSLVVAVFISGIFLGLYYRNGQLIEEETINTARADFSDITLNRAWDAGHSGLYAEKSKMLNPEKYLENPDFESLNGKLYKKIGHTLMTGEISLLAPMEGMLIFHVTSLSPLDPKNLADEFERDALEDFGLGSQEAYKKELINDKTYFRYMAPLFVKYECLECHKEQGYKAGDVRGGISLNYNIEHIQAKLKMNNIIILLLAIITIVLLVGIVYELSSNLLRKLLQAYKKIERLAVTDELTELYNRRYLKERLNAEIKRAIRYEHRLSCLMIDIDFFKKFNDTYGHPTGDRVLKEVAKVIKSTSRTEDIVARFGGEEMIVITPETDLNGAAMFAERVRKFIEELDVVGANGDHVKVTISTGVSSLTHEELKAEGAGENIIDLADRALYLAKANGRNRVETFKESK